MSKSKTPILTLYITSVFVCIASAQAGLAASDPIAGSWSDKQSTMHIIRSQGARLAISGTDGRSVFLLECNGSKDGKSTEVFTCAGKGFNEKGEFSITSLLTRQGSELIDRWTAEQAGRTFTGESRMQQMINGSNTR